MRGTLRRLGRSRVPLTSKNHPTQVGHGVAGIAGSAVLARVVVVRASRRHGAAIAAAAGASQVPPAVASTVAPSAERRTPSAERRAPSAEEPRPAPAVDRRYVEAEGHRWRVLREPEHRRCRCGTSGIPPNPPASIPVSNVIGRVSTAQLSKTNTSAPPPSDNSRTPRAPNPSVQPPPARTATRRPARWTPTTSRSAPRHRPTTDACSAKRGLTTTLVNGHTR